LPDYLVMRTRPTILKLPTNSLSAQQTRDIRDLLWAAFANDEHGAFTEEDWQHSIGGTHFIAVVDGQIVCHASVVLRDIHVATVSLRTGYVEAVATTPAHQGEGFGTAVMRDVGELISRDFELGMLGTGSQGFYERLGWRIWRGPSSVRTAAGVMPTPSEDGYIMALRTRTSPELDFEAPISCEWRPGDVW
jgi:aminoglycoside 2'-N-acetyltransferase I